MDTTLNQAAIERLSRAIQIPTVSTKDYAQTNFKPFDEFVAFLTESYPLVHAHCEPERINGYGLVYRWQGSDTTLQPIALLAHYDVVPVESGTEEDWLYPPFSGAIADDAIWGRGTLDIKSQLTGYLEVAESLIGEGYQPQHTLYFCFGHDEEVGGNKGASYLVEHFAALGLRFEAVLDEGGLVVSAALKGVRSPLALIGVAEKGHADFRLVVEGAGGHSSMPPRHSALGLLARLITRIENNPLPTRLTPPVHQMLKNVAPEMGAAVRLAVNTPSLRPVLLRILSGSPVTNAMVRTTFAATQALASDAANVLPRQAEANINVRILPGDTVESVRTHFEKLAQGLGAKVQIEIVFAQEATPFSPTDTSFFALLTELTAKQYPQAIISPYLVMGGTDSRKYYTICDNIYRFTPIHISNEDRALIHNTNEHLTLQNYANMLVFFRQLFEKL